MLGSNQGEMGASLLEDEEEAQDGDRALLHPRLQRVLLVEHQEEVRGAAKCPQPVEAREISHDEGVGRHTIPTKEKSNELVGADHGERDLDLADLEACRLPGLPAPRDGCSEGSPSSAGRSGLRRAPHRSMSSRWACAGGQWRGTASATATVPHLIVLEGLDDLVRLRERAVADRRQDRNVDCRAVARILDRHL